MGLSHRWDMCRAYLSRDREFNCQGTDVLRKLVRPTCTALAKHKIMKIEADGAYQRVYLRNFKSPLFWPQSLPIYNLYMVISESLYKDDWHYYEVPETQVAPGDIVLDCGAAEGLFSMKIMEYAQCIAIEPSPVFVQSMKKTFHDHDRVRIIPYALSNREGEAYLCPGSLDSMINAAIPEGPTDNLITVKTTTIDHLVKELGLERVDYIKGDLESFELEVLRGGEQTIRKYKPKMAFTTYHSGNDWTEMRDFVLSLVPDYAWRVKGLSYTDNLPKPVMIHFWPV